MPEEINRVLTDQISDLLFTTEAEAAENLQREGIDGARVQFVGNVMIDTLERFRTSAAAARPWLDLGLEEQGVRTGHSAPPVERRFGRRAAGHRRRPEARWRGACRSCFLFIRARVIASASWALRRPTLKRQGCT